MAKIKTLKDVSDETVYPQTVGEAVYLSNGKTLEEEVGKPYTSLERLNTYLYKVSFTDLPEYERMDINLGGCTSYVKNGKLYRNLDWQYSEAVSFIVNAENFTGMSYSNQVTRTNMDDKLIAQLPYHMVDGVNESGIMMSMHVLYNDWGWKKSGSGNIPLTKLGYLILKNVKSMAFLDRDLGDILPNLYATPDLVGADYLLQFVVTDGNTTAIIAPPTSDGQPYQLINANSNPKLTNFRWLNKQTVQYNDSSIQTRPNGTTRWNNISFPGATYEQLSFYRFTQAYTTYGSTGYEDEFIGINNTTKATPLATLAALKDQASYLYQDRRRDGETWQTMHAVVYSDAGMEELYIQENFNRNYSSHTPEKKIGKTDIDKNSIAPAVVLWENVGNGSSSSSSFTNIDIPFSSLVWDAAQGKTKYHKAVLEIICEPDGSTDNYSLKALNSSNQTIGTFQSGTECWNNDGAFIRRNSDELVAAKAIGANSVYIKAEFFLPMKVNYMPFLAHGFGGTNTDTGIQNFNGRVHSAPDGVSKLRFGLFNGGTFKLQNYYKIRLFGYKEE